jgi:asparagine synthase (glutamine-hydrolysing)
MCSINGIFCFEGKHPDWMHDRLEVMLRLTNHRGPDGVDKFVSSQVALGTARLAIQGTVNSSSIYSLPGDQKRLIFNGHIANHLDLANHLSNHLPDRSSDGAVILPLFDKFDQEFINNLHGMFAIAMHDPSRNSLQLWRDPLGVKPLYFYQDNQVVIFSSEIKAIRAILQDKPEVDFAGIDHIWRFRFQPGRETVFKNIYHVLPGETITFEQETTKHHLYWSIPTSPDSLNSSVEDITIELQDLLDRVVKEYSCADVPGGFFVSGGLDSSTITSMSLRSNHSSYKQPISILSTPQPTIDESYARELENFLGVPFEWVEISDELACQTLSEFVSYIDEPLENPIHVGTYLMAKRARDLGLKTVLTGDGADEFFLGYERHAFCTNPTFNPSDNKYVSLMKTIKSSVSEEIYTPEARAGILPIMNINDQSIEPFYNFAQVMDFEQRNRLQEYHCMRLDRMTMANGVEARVPFLDRRIVEFAQKIPFKIRYGQNSKDLLRNAAAKFLPVSILEREKAHFPSLSSRWMGGNGAKWVAEVLLDPSAKTRRWLDRNTLEKWIVENNTGQRDRGRDLWAFMVAELWLRESWI